MWQLRASAAGEKLRKAARIRLFNNPSVNVGMLQVAEASTLSCRKLTTSREMQPYFEASRNAARRAA